MLKIRLTRIGKKHQPSYRIVVTPKENPALGQYLDLVGTYNPLKGDVKIDNEKAIEWLNKGAKPSDRVARLMEKVGLKHNSIVVKHYTPKPKEEAKTEAKAEAPAEDSVETEESPSITEAPAEDTLVEDTPAE